MQNSITLAALKLWKTGFGFGKILGWNPEIRLWTAGAAGPVRRGACAGAAGPYARRRCGARPYRPAGLLPCFGILAQKRDIHPILSRFWLGLMLWHPGKHFKASGTCIWIKWLRIPFYLWSGDLVWSWTSLVSGFAFTHYICLDRGKKTFNMHASYIRICMNE